MLTVTTWIAHILAFHLSVPEPVVFKVEELWPSENKAQITLINGTWELEYDKDAWRGHSPTRRSYIIAHELCHTIYEYHVDWSKLTKKEKAQRHNFVDACARKIMKDHRRDCK